jgi:hypothetical protein
MELRFNHMELTFPPGSLTEEFCADVGAFYSDVLGFTSDVRPMFQQPSQTLTLPNGDFVLLIEGEQPMQAPGFDHLGIELSSRADVDTVLGRVKAWQARDARVELKEYDDGVMDGLLYHAFYVRHLLPIWLDIQYREPASSPEGSR